MNRIETQFGFSSTAAEVAEGTVATNFMRNVDPAMSARLEKEFKVGRLPPTFKTPQQGAATSVLLAVSPLLRGVGGRYFENCNEAIPVADANG